MKTVTLEDLQGLRVLSGVDFIGDTDTQTCRFRLDGVVYVAVEDECDGYRSMLDKIEITKDKVMNRFKGCAVNCVLDDELLNMIDVKTGEIVLSVGTNTDCNYYPYFVSSFHPENMACNMSKLK